MRLPRKLVEIANGVEAVQDGRIFIERVNELFLAAGSSGVGILRIGRTVGVGTSVVQRVLGG